MNKRLNKAILPRLRKATEYEVTVKLNDATKDLGLGLGVLAVITYKFAAGSNPITTILRTEDDWIKKYLSFEWREVK
jgi:hypothetical protein